jgi:hypothetical protein
MEFLLEKCIKELYKHIMINGIIFERSFVMLCTNQTEKECIGRNLFGDKEFRLPYFKEIRKGDIGFLLNVSRNHLIGVFRAISEVQLDIEPDAWSGEFRAQVRVEPRGKLKKLGEAASILANSGIPLADLPSGALVPIYPVLGKEITMSLLDHFGEGVVDERS